jgi:hypothetical protein
MDGREQASWRQAGRTILIGVNHTPATMPNQFAPKQNIFFCLSLDLPAVWF